MTSAYKYAAILNEGKKTMTTPAKIEPLGATMWKKIAVEFANNADFYRGLVIRIGAQFGKPAYTSDDGSVQQDVLALKVPELVAALITASTGWEVKKRALNTACCGANKIAVNKDFRDFIVTVEQILHSKNPSSEKNSHER